MFRSLLALLTLCLAGCATTTTTTSLAPVGKRAEFIQVEQKALNIPILDRVDYIDSKYRDGTITVEEATYLIEPAAAALASARAGMKDGHITMAEVEAADLAAQKKYSNRPPPVNHERYDPAEMYRPDPKPLVVRQTPQPRFNISPPSDYRNLSTPNNSPNYFPSGNTSIVRKSSTSSEPLYIPPPLPRSKIIEVNRSNSFLATDYRGRTTKVTPIEGGYETRTAEGYRTVVKDSGMGYSVERDNQGNTRRISGTPFNPSTGPSGVTTYSPSGGGYKPR